MDADRDRMLAGLLVEAQDGSQAAYESFLVEASAVLRGFLGKRMGGAESVEDVLQETLLSVHRARHTYLPGRPLGPWLYATCEHRRIGHPVVGLVRWAVLSALCIAAGIAAFSLRPDLGSVAGSPTFLLLAAVAVAVPANSVLSSGPGPPVSESHASSESLLFRWWRAY